MRSELRKPRTMSHEPELPPPSPNPPADGIRKYKAF